jgi:hypothetical protein
MFAYCHVIHNHHRLWLRALDTQFVVSGTVKNLCVTKNKIQFKFDEANINNYQ